MEGERVISSERTPCNAVPVFCCAIYLVFMYILVHAAQAPAEEAGQRNTIERSSATGGCNPSTLDIVKQAMPPAPAEWLMIQDAGLQADALFRIDSSAMPCSYSVLYKKIKGIKEETQRLEKEYSASYKKHSVAAKPLIDELIKQQTEASLALRKASRRRDHNLERKLNEELDENGRKMRALHADTDRKIGQDIEGYLIRDAEASIRVSLDETYAELPNSAAISEPKAAGALISQGRKTGMIGWKEGQRLVLYGNWRQVSETAFRADPGQMSNTPGTGRISILITGDPARIEQLWQKMDVRALTGLL